MKNIDDIKLPDNIDSLTENAIKMGEKYNKSKIQRRKKYIVAATICCVLSLGASSLGAVANEIPIVGDVFYALKHELGLRGTSKGTSIGQTVTDNGVSITIQDVICDEYGVYASYIVKSDKPLTKDLNNTQLVIYDSYGTTDFHKSHLDTGGIGGLEGKFIDENTFVGVETYLFREDVKIPDEFKIDIGIGAVSHNSIEDDSIVEGKWNFSIPVKLNSDGVKIIEPNIKEHGIYINKLILSKLHGFFELEVPEELKVKLANSVSVDIITDSGEEISIIGFQITKDNILKIRTKGIPEDTKKLIFKFENHKAIEVNLD